MAGKTKGKSSRKKRQKSVAPAPVPPYQPCSLPSFDSGLRFVPERLLGSGGLCEVWLAVDLLHVACGSQQPRVALKKLLPEFKSNGKARQLLFREFAVLSRLCHPGLIRVYDLHKEDEDIFLSMELLEGESVHQRLAGKADSPNGLHNARNIAAALFGSLAYLHAQGVVHGDVKPANIICAGDNRHILCDFNTAEALPQPGQASTSMSHALMNELKVPAFSLLHASPERLAGGDAAAADDVFAACCSIYEAFEGRHPFKRHTALEAMGEKLTLDKPLFMPSVLDSLQQKTLLAGLGFKPGERPTADELHILFTGRKSGLRRFFSFRAFSL